MKRIYYWSPCLNKVGTYKSTINSAISLAKYSKKYEIKIINSCGEWNDEKKNFLDNRIEIINFGFNYFKYLPKIGFFKSRFSYLLIILTSIIPLLRLLIKDKPEFFVVHLITSLPLILMKLINTKTKFILRISGFPKLNYFRNLLWKNISNRIDQVTCPSIDLLNQLNKKNIFDKNKIKFLPDPILNIKEFGNKKRSLVINNQNKRKFFISIGRLTKQKNFIYLINEFKKFSEINDNYDLYIFGEGDLKMELNNQIHKNKLENKVFLKGYSKNIFPYLIRAEAFILSSLWEDPGFVLIEAAACNLFIISSDCKNGPREFLDNGKNGILYESNKNGSLSFAIQQYFQTENKFKMKLNAKKNCRKYTLFHHYKYFENILNLN